MTLSGGYDPHTHARDTDPDTSVEAAEKLSTMGKHCRWLLEAFTRQSVLPGYTGLTMEEAALYAAVDPWAASKRISDLRRMRMIEYVYDSTVPRTRRGSSKRKQRVYDITERGREALEAVVAMSPPFKALTHCCDCDKQIVDGDTWSWCPNGPVHDRHRKTDAELRAMLDENNPCTGCTTDCPDYLTKCANVDMISYGDGIDYADIYRDGTIIRYGLWQPPPPGDNGGNNTEKETHHA